MNKIEAPTKFGIGNALTRFEDGRFLTGRGRYVDDLRPEGCLDAVFLRSPVAHARLISVSADEARAMPGVVAVLTDADLAADGLTDVPLRTKIPFIDGRPMAEPRRPLLARDKLVYVGQPVAMVIAESRAAAIDARDAIELDWEELPAVTDPAAALAEGAEQIHPEAPGNLAFDWEIGDEAAADAALAGAVRRVSLPIVNNRIAVVPMEPRGVLSWMDQETGMLHIEGALQQVFAFKNFISSALGMEAEKVHVSAPDVGGGFGGKNQVQADYVLTAHAARRLGRPVKWIDDRSDAFVADTQARSVLSDVTLGFDAEGRITGLRIDSVADLGANVSTNGALIPTSAAAAVLGGTYKVPAIYMKVRATFTNTTPVDAYRGAGRPEVIFLIERAMDKAAAEFGLTPVEIRRRNFIPASAMPYDTPIGRTIDVGDFEGVMDKALAAAGWDGFAARKADSATRGLKRGFGLVSYLECTLGPPVETADIVVSGDGRVELALGTQSNGQGHETTFAQILADKLDVDIDRIGFTQADTARIPVGGGHGGSRSTQLGGTALVKTVEVVVEKGRLIAADRLEAAAGGYRVFRRQFPHRRHRPLDDPLRGGRGGRGRPARRAGDL